jgi:hypothetical protein
MPALTLDIMPDHIFALLVDTIAKAIVEDQLMSAMLKPIEREREKSGWSRMDGEAAKRFACFMAADGNNHWARFVVDRRRKILRFVQGPRYFDGQVGFEYLNGDDVAQEALLMRDGLQSEKGVRPRAPLNEHLRCKPASPSFSLNERNEQWCFGNETKSLFYHGPLTEDLLRVVERQQKLELEKRSTENTKEKSDDRNVIETDLDLVGHSGSNSDESLLSLESFDSLAIHHNQNDNFQISGVRLLKDDESVARSTSIHSTSSVASTMSYKSADPLYHFHAPGSSIRNHTNWPIFYWFTKILIR